MYQHVSNPTRGRGTTNTNLLDLILSNEEDNIGEIEYLSPLGKSDHCVITFNILCKVITNKYTKKRKLFNKANYEGMRKECSDINWEEKFKDCKDNVNDQWEILKTVLRLLEDKYVPQKEVSNYRKGNFPLNANTRKLIRRKNRLWTRYIETRDGTKYLEYCKSRNKIRALTRKLRKEFEKNLAIQTKKNPKVFWNYYKSKTTVKQGIGELNIDHTNPKSQTTTEDEEKANILANYFSSVFTTEQTGSIPTTPKVNIKLAMDELKVTENIILLTLKELNISKSPGPDEIGARLLTELSENICLPLQKIFETSIKTSSIPDEWKDAKISAIYKKGNKKLACNYRPISLTSVVCKCMEKIIRNHIISYMKVNGLFSQKQYGFISGRSTVLQLIKILDEWTSEMDKGNYIDVIYMDFQKAFDTVPHTRLISKLKSFNIRNDLVNWIEAFITNRRQKVAVNGKESNWHKVTSGIPQGSVLGPLLFVLYVNDLPDLTKSNTFLFADDIKIFRAITNKNDQDILQQDLSILEQWSDKWLLKFHPDKCKHMEIGKNNIGENEYFMTSNNVKHSLATTDKQTDLGVIIDSKLSFDDHINQVVNKATKMTKIIRRTFQS